MINVLYVRSRESEGLKELWLHLSLVLLNQNLGSLPELVQKSSFLWIKYKVKEEKQNAKKNVFISVFVFNNMVCVEQYFKKFHLQKPDCSLHIVKDEIFDVACVVQLWDCWLRSISIYSIAWPFLLCKHELVITSMCKCIWKNRSYF